MERSPDTLIGAIVLFNLVMGVLAGLFPLLVGRAYQRRGEGWAGFGICVACGFFGSFFVAVPMAILFTLAIVFLGKNEVSEDSEPPDHESRVRLQRELIATRQKLAEYDALEWQARSPANEPPQASAPPADGIQALPQGVTARR